MAKWSGIYLEDSHTLLKKIEKKLEKVVDEKRRYEDGTSLVKIKLREGRQHLANELQNKIKKWRKEMYNE
tara:strand:+ start:465 stop:674 length:210 start_codon:yes stop_codon:yes gene_type:complete